MDQCKLDLYYTVNFPLAEKYIALYAKTEIKNQQVSEKREQLRKQLREQMLQGDKKVSGSNQMQLGQRKPTVSADRASATESEGEESEGGTEHSGIESEVIPEMGETDTEEDEFLDLRRKT